MIPQWDKISINMDYVVYCKYWCSLHVWFCVVIFKFAMFIAFKQRVVSVAIAVTVGGGNF